MKLNEKVSGGLLLAGLVAFIAACGVRMSSEITEAGAARVTRALMTTEAVSPFGAGVSQKQSKAIKNLLALPPPQRIPRLAEMLPAMTEAELSALLRGLPGEGSGLKAADLELRLLFTRWAELNPSGLLAELRSPAFDARVEVRRLAAGAWAERAGIAALRAVQPVWPGIARAAAMEMAVRQPERIATLVPWLKPGEPVLGELYWLNLPEKIGSAGFLRLAAELDCAEERTYALSWLKEKKLSDLSIADALPEGRMRESVRLTLLANLAEADSTAFEREFTALPPGPLREGLTPACANILQKTDPREAVRLIDSLPGGEMKSAAVVNLAGSMYRQFPQLALELAVSHRETGAPLPNYLSDPARYSLDIDSLIREAYTVWIRRSPAEAAAWLGTVKHTGVRADLSRQLADRGVASPEAITGSFARLDFAADLLAVQSHATNDPSSPARRSPAELAVIGKAVAGLPADLREVADWFAKGGDRRVTAEEWDATGTEGRRFLSEGRLNSAVSAEERLDLFNGMAPQERSLAAWRVAAASALTLDATATEAWIDGLPAGPERDAAAIALVDQLVGAATLIHYYNSTEEGNSPGTDRLPEEEPVTQATGKPEDAAPALAKALHAATGMHGAVERAGLAWKVAEQWARTDPAAARAAVEQSALPLPEKTALLHKLEEGRAQ